MIEFDGVTFETESDLINWLKHNYFAAKIAIKNLQKALDDANTKADFWKSEHDAAVKELRQAYKDLNSAEREITDLESRY